MKVIKLAVAMIVSGKMRRAGEIVIVPDNFDEAAVAETIKKIRDVSGEENSTNVSG